MALWEKEPTWTIALGWEWNWSNKKLLILLGTISRRWANLIKIESKKQPIISGYTHAARSLNAILPSVKIQFTAIKTLTPRIWCGWKLKRTQPKYGEDINLLEIGKQKLWNRSKIWRIIKSLSLLCNVKNQTYLNYFYQYYFVEQ